MFQGDKLRVEILSLAFEPSSRVALDKSVQRVYVEYRLLGVPMETTETPMSLRKPKKGEEIHYNFTRGENVAGVLPMLSQISFVRMLLLLRVPLSDLRGRLSVRLAQAVSLHHAGGQRPQPGQVQATHPAPVRERPCCTV